MTAVTRGVRRTRRSARLRSFHPHDPTHEFASPVKAGVVTKRFSGGVRAACRARPNVDWLGGGGGGRTIGDERVRSWAFLFPLW
jgi:hypothetical protein